MVWGLLDDLLAIDNRNVMSEDHKSLLRFLRQDGYRMGGLKARLFLHALEIGVQYKTKETKSSTQIEAEAFAFNDSLKANMDAEATDIYEDFLPNFRFEGVTVGMDVLSLTTWAPWIQDNKDGYSIEQFAYTTRLVMDYVLEGTRYECYDSFAPCENVSASDAYSPTFSEEEKEYSRKNTESEVRT